MVNLFVKTTGVFSRVHPNLSTMLYCPEYKAENRKMHSAHSVSQNGGKDKMGPGTFFSFTLILSQALCLRYVCPTTPGALSFQSNLSVLPLLSLHHQAVKTAQAL